MLVMNTAARPARVSCYTKSAILAILMFVARGMVAAHADVNSFTLKQPLDNATVRETVPVRVPRNYLAQAAYATIYIDSEFRSAPAVPDSGETVYQWDTKAPFTTQDQPSPQTTADGSHTIIVHLFDKDSNEVAMATSTVRVANKITSLPDGVHLIYRWKPNEVTTYDIQTTLSASSNTLQSTNVKLDRSVEDMSGNEILLRDLVRGSGYVSAGSNGTSASQMQDSGTSTLISTAYSPGSKYWTVDKFGVLLADNKPISSGNHYGFPVPEFPARRVNVGDSWQTHMLASLQWASNKPTFLRGTGRLDDFEWQDHYPTAKIVETYTGPARFFIDGADANTPVDAGSVQLTRTVWFAYEAGMVVRIETSLTTSAQMSSAQYSALGAPQGGSGGMTRPGSERMNPMLRQQLGDTNGDNGDDSNIQTPGAPVIQRNPFEQARTQQDQRIPLNLTSTSTMTIDTGE